MLAWQLAEGPAAFSGLGRDRAGADDISRRAVAFTKRLAPRKYGCRHRGHVNLAADSNHEIRYVTWSHVSPGSRGLDWTGQPRRTPILCSLVRFEHTRRRL